MESVKRREKKLEELHQLAVEMYGKQQVHKIDLYQKYLVINPANLTFCQIGDILDEFSAAIETGKIAHEIYPGKKEEINITMEGRKKYTMLVEYLEDAIKFTFRFVGYGTAGDNLENAVKPKRERAKLIERQANEQIKMVEEEMENKRKRSENKASFKQKSVPIVCCETGVVYPSVKACARDLGISETIIYNFLRGKTTEMSTGGYTFKLYNDDNFRPRRNKIVARRVKCIETDRIFPSLSSAEKWLRSNTTYEKADKRRIYSSAFRPDELSAYGFHWMFCDKDGNQVVD